MSMLCIKVRNHSFFNIYSFTNINYVIINIEKFDEKTLSLTLSNAKASDIVNYLSSHGHDIANLHLQKIGRLDLGNLKKGQYREISENIKI